MLLSTRIPGEPCAINRMAIIYCARGGIVDEDDWSQPLIVVLWDAADETRCVVAHHEPPIAPGRENDSATSVARYGAGATKWSLTPALRFVSFGIRNSVFQRLA